MDNRLYSNPFSAFVDGQHQEEYTFEPKGNIPFCVRFSKTHWIPVNVLVFSDTPENAIKQVEEGLLFVAEIWHRDRESDHRDATLRTEKQAHIAEFLKTAKREAMRITPNQMFKIGWASNDYIGV